MNNVLLQKAMKLNRERKRKISWQRVVSVMAGVVMFCTTYALILPAITMEKDPICGFEAHEHTEQCYTEQAVYEWQCDLGDKAVAHTHNDFCFNAQGTLICQLQENESHAHSIACTVTKSIQTCTLEETEDHTHDESCYESQQELTCTLAETVTHDHKEHCLVLTEQKEQILTCQLTEHIHEDACYPLEESDEAESNEYLCGNGEHTHGDNCLDSEGILTCNIPEHIHEASCLLEDLDLKADVELTYQWEATMADVQLTGNWPEDVVAIAKTQLGYKESKKNCILEDGVLKGYTRYGDWYGVPYGDWCAMYASFCLHYAGVEDFPLDANCNNWINDLEKAELYRTPDTYTPKPGDLIFFDWQQPQAGKIVSDHVGLVVEIIPATEDTPAQIKTIEGNTSNKVAYATYDLDDPIIIGYGELPIGNFSVLTHVGEDYTVTVSFNAEANIPENATLEVEEILPGTEEYNTYYQQSVETLLNNATAATEEELDVSFARFFDISFVVDGKIIEPEAPVDIQILYNNGIEIAEQNNGVAVHFAKDGIEVLDTQTSQNQSEQVDTFEFTQNSFSVTGTLVTYDVRAVNAYTTVSPNSLDATGRTQYVVYTKLGNNYYAVDGNGNAQRITLANDGSISSAVNNNLLWTFTYDNAINTHIIRNVGTRRYMHSYDNNTGEGVTTEGAYSSTLLLAGDGKELTFSVQSNSDYSQLSQSGNQVRFIVTQTADSASQFYLAALPSAVSNYHVWFDGTNGGIMSLYGSDNTYRAVSSNNSTITLPDTWKSPSKYAYKLNGWYDIVSNTYYPAGAEVTITQNTVFYADWVAATYDIGVDNEHTVNSLDTDSFITTYVFDYNSLFNVQSLAHLGSITASGHTERWTIKNSGKVPYNDENTLGFAFIDYDMDGPHISYADGRTTKNINQSSITPGILDDVHDVSNKDLLDLLFNPNTAVMGKNYVGTGNYLFQYMDSTSENYDGHDGYYYFHSRLNAAAYNQSEGRFYLYDYLERTSDSEKDGGPGEFSDFLPFNSPYANHQNLNIGTYTDPDSGMSGHQYDAKANGEGSAYRNAGTNYWFGIRSDVEFFLPNDAGYHDEYGNYGNISTKGQHMIFEFHGDDDLWVFVDGELLLDVGGIHGVEYGQIDFSTGTVTSGEGNEAVTKSIDVKEGTHTMTVYYMERGSSQSNCSIYFNVAPRYDLEITKQDIFTADALDGAEFSIYTDEALTHPAELWPSYEAHLADLEDGSIDDDTNVFVVKDGVAKCWGLSAGKTYYITETKPPEGYPYTDDMIRITLNNRGVASIETTTLHGENGIITEGFAVIEQDVNDTLKIVALLVTNQEDGDTTKVRVQKTWDENSVNIPESIQVYLTRDGERVGRIATLNESNGWAYTWTGLPMYDELENKIEYEVEEVLVSGYNTELVGREEVVERVDWIRTDSMEDQITYVLVNNNRALSYNGQSFSWVEINGNNPIDSLGLAAQWTVTTDHVGFHLKNGNGYHITFNPNTNRFYGTQDDDVNLNQVFYFLNSRLVIQDDDVYYHFGDNGIAVSSDGLVFTLYRKEVLTGTLVHIHNVPIDEEKQTFLEVNKVWEDGEENHRYDSVTMHLYADGEDTGRTVILNAQNDWQGSFEGLPYYQDDGETVVRYSIVEEPIHNYSPSYSEPTSVDGREFTAWRSVNVLTPSNNNNPIYYRFTSGGYSLACDTNGQLISKGNNLNDTYQQWQVTTSGNKVLLRNVGSGRYLSYSGSSLSTVTNTTNAQTVTLDNNNGSLRLRAGSRYIIINPTSIDSTTASNNATVLTVTHLTEVTGQEGSSITVTNSQAVYNIPETGGLGILHYTFGGLLILAIALMYISKFGLKRQKGGG